MVAGGAHPPSLALGRSSKIFPYYTHLDSDSGVLLPAALVALVLYSLSAGMRSSQIQGNTPEMAGNPMGLIMFIVPVVIIFLLLKK